MSEFMYSENLTNAMIQRKTKILPGYTDHIHFGVTYILPIRSHRDHTFNVACNASIGQISGIHYGSHYTVSLRNSWGTQYTFQNPINTFNAAVGETLVHGDITEIFINERSTIPTEQYPAGTTNLCTQSSICQASCYIATESAVPTCWSIATTK